MAYRILLEMFTITRCDFFTFHDAVYKGARMYLRTCPALTIIIILYTMKKLASFLPVQTLNYCDRHLVLKGEAGGVYIGNQRDRKP